MNFVSKLSNLTKFSKKASIFKKASILRMASFYNKKKLSVILKIQKFVVPLLVNQSMHTVN